MVLLPQEDGWLEQPVDCRLRIMILLLQEDGWLGQPDGCRISSGECQRVVSLISSMCCCASSSCPAAQRDRKYGGDNERVIVQVGDW